MDSGFTILHDKDIREPLFDFLEETYGRIRILEEKTMGNSRADVLMVTNKGLYGIEIKSDADSYQRLSRQVKDYDKFFDYNIAVVGTKHTFSISDHVPDYWGIITVEEVDSVVDFYMLRKPKQNENMKWERKLELLWRMELAAIQEKFGMPKYKEKSRGYVISKICERMPEKISENELCTAVCEVLFERDYSRVTEMIAEYRKSEFDKKIEATNDENEKMELMMKKEIAKVNLKSKVKKRRRRRY